MAKISVTLTLFLVLFIAASGFAAPKPGLLPGAQGAQRPAEPEVAYTDPLGREHSSGCRLRFHEIGGAGKL